MLKVPESVTPDVEDTATAFIGVAFTTPDSQYIYRKVGSAPVPSFLTRTFTVWVASIVDGVSKDTVIRVLIYQPDIANVEGPQSRV